MHGAGHEAGRRAGTENVLLNVGLGAACDLALKELDSRFAHLTAMRDRLQGGLERLFGRALRLNGHPSARLPNTLNVSFIGHTGSLLLDALGNLAASTGSACHSGRHDLSPVLKAMGVPENVGLGAVRFSVGRATTQEEIDIVLELMRTQVLQKKL
jgi:cysteine desulfurase